MEVHSPSTDKYQEEGVREYWIEDPYNDYIEAYHLINAAFKLQGSYFIPSETLKLSEHFDIQLRRKGRANAVKR